MQGQSYQSGLLVWFFCCFDVLLKQFDVIVVTAFNLIKHFQQGMLPYIVSFFGVVLLQYFITKYILDQALFKIFTFCHFFMLNYSKLELMNPPRLQSCPNTRSMKTDRNINMEKNIYCDHIFAIPSMLMSQTKSPEGSIHCYLRKHMQINKT